MLNYIPEIREIKFWKVDFVIDFGRYWDFLKQRIITIVKSTAGNHNLATWINDGSTKQLIITRLQVIIQIYGHIFSVYPARGKVTEKRNVETWAEFVTTVRNRWLA